MEFASTSVKVRRSHALDNRGGHSLVDNPRERIEGREEQHLSAATMTTFRVSKVSLASIEVPYVAAVVMVCEP